MRTRFSTSWKIACNKKYKDVILKIIDQYGFLLWMYIYFLPVESAFSGKCMLCSLTCVCDEYPPFICNSISQVTVASLVKCLALFSIMILSMLWSIALNARNFAQSKVSKMLVDSFSGKTLPPRPRKRNCLGIISSNLLTVLTEKGGFVRDVLESRLWACTASQHFWCVPTGVQSPNPNYMFRGAIEACHPSTVTLNPSSRTPKEGRVAHMKRVCDETCF